MQYRSQQKELIDLGPDFYTEQEYAHCLQMLFRVNRFLGFFASTCRQLRRVPAEASVLDVGCGNGLFLLHLSRYYPRMRMQGVDVSKPAIELAQKTLAEWQLGDKAAQVKFTLQPQFRLDLAPLSVDVVLTTLVCHHIEDDDLVIFLQDIYHAAAIQVVINDLHRHHLAYRFYAWMSPWLFRNRLITHDGLISIQRGFKRAEWHALLQRAGIKQYQIKWRFPFRWSVILWKN